MNKIDKNKASRAIEQMFNVNKVKVHLKQLITKMSDQVADSQLHGRIPGDYSLGFLNAVIFVEHKLSGRADAPQFFNREMAIGTLPVPVALRSPGEVTAEFNRIGANARNKEIAFMEQQVITQSRGVVAAMEQMEKEEEPNENTVKAFSVSLAAMKKTIAELDDVATKHEEMLHEQKKRLAVIAENQKAAESQPSSIGNAQGLDET
jgi:hypothetical protein